MYPQTKAIPQPQRGFTLIEIMIVVAIIGILAGLVASVVGGRDDEARVQAARADLKTLANALELYKLDNYRYPSSEQGLEALMKDPGDAPNWNPQGYLKGKEAPKDPWKREYIYESSTSSGTPYVLFSLGADGAEGGEGFAEDIYAQ
jgi:general secretion pathway protein G